MRRIILRRNDETFDITGKNFILYGAGNAMFDLVENVGIQNIFKIIDKKALECEKSNRWVQVNNLHVEVVPPNELLRMSPVESIILITSYRYEKEIRRDLEKLLGKKTDFLVCSRREIDSEYDNIEELLYQDPIMKQKICDGKLSFEIKRIISKFNEVVADLKLESEKGRFSSVKGGSQKLLFTFGRTHRYIFSVPYIYNMDAMRYEQYLNKVWRDIEVKQQSFQIRKQYGIGMELMLYEDENGYSMQYYADEVLLFESEDVVAKVMNKLRQLHSLKIKGLRCFDVIDDFRANMIIAEKKYPEWKNILNIMKKSSEYLINIGGGNDVRQNKVVCHGDLFFTNIVSCKGEIFFIDWDMFCCSDPYYDVGRFLYSIYGFSEEKIGDFYKGLSLYVQRENIVPIVGRCLAIIVLNQWRQLLSSFNLDSKTHMESGKIKIAEAVKMADIVKTAM